MTAMYKKEGQGRSSEAFNKVHKQVKNRNKRQANVCNL